MRLFLDTNIFPEFINRLQALRQMAIRQLQVLSTLDVKSLPQLA